MNSTGTSMNSAGLANLEAISSTEHAAIVIDPGRTAGAPEIVYVTAHTGSATSATIQRAREGTAARAHSSTEDWVHAPTATIDYIAFRPPSVKVRTNAATTTADNTDRTVPFQVEVFDSDAMWSSTANTRLIARTAGKYLVGGSIEWTNSSGGTFRNLVIKRSGVDTMAVQQQGSDMENTNVRQAISSLVPMTTGQYVELLARQNSGGPLNITAASTSLEFRCNFWATWQSS